MVVTCGPRFFLVSTAEDGTGEALTDNAANTHTNCGACDVLKKSTSHCVVFVKMTNRN